MPPQMFAAGNEEVLIKFKGLLEQFPFEDVSALWVSAGGWICPHNNQSEVDGVTACEDCGLELENEDG